MSANSSADMPSRSATRVKMRARRRRHAVAGQRRAQLQFDERAQQVVPQAAGFAQTLDGEFDVVAWRPCRCGNRRSLRRFRAAPKCSSCISRRAASISASDTRPSDLATWPINSKVVRKNTFGYRAGAAPPAPRSRRPLIEHMPMNAPMTAPQALRVTRRPISAPKNLPFQLIRVDLYEPSPPQSPTFYSAMVAAAGRAHVEQIFAFATAIRIAVARFEKNSPG